MQSKSPQPCTFHWKVVAFNRKERYFHKKLPMSQLLMRKRTCQLDSPCNWRCNCRVHKWVPYVIQKLTSQFQKLPHTLEEMSEKPQNTSVEILTVKFNSDLHKNWLIWRIKSILGNLFWESSSLGWLDVIFQNNLSTFIPMLSQNKSSLNHFRSGYILLKIKNSP